MSEHDEGRALDEWIAFAGESVPEGRSRRRETLRHPLVLAAAAIGVVVVVGLIVLRPTGTAREVAEESRSVIGLPTDFFEAETSSVTTGPCPGFEDQDCSTVRFDILEGPDQGSAYTQVFLSGGTAPKFEEGTRVVLSYRAPNARVTAITPAPCDFDPSFECERIDVVLIRGSAFGSAYEIFVPAGSSELRTNDLADVSFDEQGVPIGVSSAEISTRYQFADFERSNVLTVILVLFAVAVIALGRWRGVAALAGLGATVAVVLLWLLPAVLDGRSPVWVALIGASAVAYIALYVSHGFSLMTTVALLGTLSALAITTLLSAVTVWAAQFTGFVTEESGLLTLFDGIDVTGLVLAGMVLGAAGALDDVTVTQSSAVWQLHRSSPDSGFTDLWQGGIRIGQHHIGSTVNTLLLAYLGASLPLAVLFVLAQQSLGTIANSEVVAIEIVRTLVGSIGLVMAVPITTWLAARTATGLKSRAT